MGQSSSRIEWSSLAALAVCVILAVGQVASAQQAATAERFVVVSGHPDATAIGLQVLRDGGNVIDAAVATSLAVGVAEPYGSGLGGKLMLLYREASSGEVHAIEAMCTASAALDPAEFAALRARQRYFGYTAVAVPGLVAGLHAAHERWGSRPWQETVEPAADLAERGVAICNTSRRFYQAKVTQLKNDPEAARLYLVDGRAPDVGTLMKNPDLARSLRQIADRGPQAFYDGEIAEHIVAAAEAAGVPLTRDDLRGYRPRWGEPLVAHYNGYEVYSCPPPLTGGTTVLASLRALAHVDSFDVSAGRDAAYIDAMSRVMLAVYPPVTREIADVPAALAAARSLVGAAASRRLSAEATGFDPADPYGKRVPAAVSERGADDMPDASTTHLTIADREGNIVCLTQSLSYHFGACVVAPGTGFLLNNSMSNFATADPAGVNYIGRGKRERSTIAPIIATRDGRPALALGIPGGQRIPTTTIQLLADVLGGGVPLVEAIDRPRFHVQRPRGSNDLPNLIDLEEDAPAVLDGQLESLGWKTVRKRRDGAYFGGGNAVRYRDDGSLEGVADLRRTNFAAGE